MIRFLLRFIGLCLLATAFVFLVYDGTKSIANQHLVYTKVGELWANIDQASLNHRRLAEAESSPGPGIPICRRFFDQCRLGRCWALSR